MPSNIENDLESAIEDLLYPSETDAPFEVVHWQDGETLDEKKVLQLSGHKPGDPVETLSTKDFFKELTATHSWFEAVEKAAAKKYVRLQSIIEQLQDPQVFKVGEIEMDIYIVGKIANGEWIGVKTRAVET